MKHNKLFNKLYYGSYFVAKQLYLRIAFLFSKYRFKDGTTMRFEAEFNKYGGRRWYAVIPEWKGSKASLEMVSGADLFLDALSEGQGFVELKLSLARKPYFYKLKKTRNAEYGGAYYVARGPGFSVSMWLCEVTLFVFGKYPDTIYYKKVKP
jgi:hypothetical protein